MKYIHEIEDANPRRVSGGSSSAAQPRTRWLPPLKGTTKIRVDGAVSRDGNFGSFSVICRNSSGVFLGASAIKIHGVSDPTTQEALACREALALAADLDLHRILIASDYQRVVNDINNVTGGVYASISREIKDTSDSFDSCTFIFEGRTTNIESHSLAKHAFDLDFGHHVWLLNPPNITCIPLNIYEF
ncbi:hypothetical protein ZWY2020_010231 [Hordeum vulgare]|nr:hypothetical protein ZWY2020_010231 [Hordeum vulgare]